MKKSRDREFLTLIRRRTLDYIRPTWSQFVRACLRIYISSLPHASAQARRAGGGPVTSRPDLANPSTGRDSWSENMLEPRPPAHPPLLWIARPVPRARPPARAAARGRKTSRAPDKAATEPAVFYHSQQCGDTPGTRPGDFYPSADMAPPWPGTTSRHRVPRIMPGPRPSIARSKALPMGYKARVIRVCNSLSCGRSARARSACFIGNRPGPARSARTMDLDRPF
jgi:hypothetical protein